MLLRTLVPALSLLLLSGCGEPSAQARDDGELRQLRAQVAELSQQIRQLSVAQGAGPAAHAAPAGHGGHAADPRQMPQTALDLLVAGNAAFVRGDGAPSDLSDTRRRELATGQKPYATILGCSDSRSSPEHLFHAGLGDLFIIRSAGNTAFDAAVASIEYSVAHAGVKLIVIMGHAKCGAVGAACANNHETPAVGNLVDSIIPAVEAARAEHAADLTERSSVINAWMQRDELLKRSTMLRKLADEDQIKVVVARHDLAGGQVEWMDLDGLRGAVATSALAARPMRPVRDNAMPAATPGSRPPATRPGPAAPPADPHGH